MCWKWKSRTSARCATASSTSSASSLPPLRGKVSATRTEGGLPLDLRHGSVGVFALRTILAERAQQRRIRRRIQHRVVPAGIHVPAPEEIRQRLNVVLFPIEALLA